MSNIVSRLDVTQIFCDVDDFCGVWEKGWQQTPQLPRQGRLTGPVSHECASVK